MKFLEKKYFDFIKKQETTGTSFYNTDDQLKNFFIPICDYITKLINFKKKQLIVGLSGGQGSGKTTISQILKIILKDKYKLNVVCFSIDDFYKTSTERKKMAKEVHHLFLTRGVPGTHDCQLLLKTFNALKVKKFKKLLIPKFDKSKDDRCNIKKWQKVKKKPDVIIFEGWCVGARSQQASELKKPLNDLEKNEDRTLTWRKKVNNELKDSYKKIFKLLDKKIYLKVPNFRYVLKWRLLQEKKLRFKFPKKAMTNNEIKKFVMYYERITKNMTKNYKINDVVAFLDKKHRIKSIRIR